MHGTVAPVTSPANNIGVYPLCIRCVACSKRAVRVSRTLDRLQLVLVAYRATPRRLPRSRERLLNCRRPQVGVAVRRSRGYRVLRETGGNLACRRGGVSATVTTRSRVNYLEHDDDKTSRTTPDQLVDQTRVGN